uniref:Rho GTPase-activating protein 26 n=1 Tax=Parascaris univalens TaxID=6257 RepID=A0A915CHL9_PARUN
MMVLRPLEFADCLSDSPWFRQNLHEHESVLEDAHKNIKNIESQCRELIQCTRKLSIAQRAFAKSLKEFKFITIGSTQTDDERKIAECLSKFGDFINQIEDHREKIVEDSETHLLEPLKRFRVEAIGKVLHEDKKKYEKESNKFYASLEKHLHLSTARKNDFKEADAQLNTQQRNFCKCSLDYVTAIQSVQERMKFEFVETLSTFLYSWLTFYHVGHVTHEDFKPFLSEVQSKVQKAKQSFDETKEYYVQLKEKMLFNHLKNAVFQSGTGKDSRENTTPRAPSSIKQGYVFVQEKSKIPKTIGRDVLSNRWTKYYCVYQKETRIFTMIPVNSTAKTDMKGALGQSVSFKLKSCTRRASDSIDKRFCFDVCAIERPEPITLQALSEEDRRQWLDAMDGREPIYSPGTGPPTNTFGTMLDEAGFEFVKKCIEAIEEKGGIREQGLYRNCGVTSKVQRLMQIGLDKRRSSNEKLNFTDDAEWETKTISSAIKTFLRNLPEPLMTFDLHSQFINAAKMDCAMRVSHIHYYVHQLPKTHIDMLKIIIEHLKKVADRSSENLMTVGNLGVCFGPTLLRPKEETMAAIMDIKFCNVVVEVLIANCDLIFNTHPSNIDGVPCPPKPLHRSGDSPESSTPFLDATPSIPKQSSVSPQSADKRSYAESSVSSGSRPRSIGNSSSRQRYPRIYDRVANSQDDSNISSPTRLVPTYGKPSTSAGTTPMSPTSGAALSSPALNQSTTPRTHHMKRATSTQANTAQLGSTTGRQRAPDGEVCGESSDSLNSIESGSDLSPSPTGPHQQSADTSRDRNASAVKAKMSSSYAPAYNPFACESVHAGTSPFSDVSVSECGGGGGTKHGAASNQGVNTTYSSHLQNVTLSELRVSPLFSYVHPIGSLQPSRRVKTLYACTAGHDTELSFQPGQIITNVYESKEEGWLVGTLNGKTGLIPANYVEPLP